VYNNPNVNDGEFAALQSFLNSGGTVIVDAKSLLLNEYGQKRTQKLVAGKGKLIALDASADIAEIKKVALAEVADNMPDVVIAEDNGVAHKATTWRTVKQADGSYLVNVLNVGHNTAKLDLSLRNGKSVSITNLMTGNALDSAFELESEGILLLEVKPI
jgi:beta-galactosidase